jgi:hypothetical protein
MYKSTIALTLSLLTAPALTPAAMAQGGPPAITEAEAHAIAVDAYVYLYSVGHHGHNSEAIHQHRARQGVGQRPDEHVQQHT